MSSLRPAISSTVKRFAKSAVRAMGLEIRRRGELPSHAPGIRHAEVFPDATYSPWLADEEFDCVYRVIRAHTLVDIYRCYELWQLISEAAKLPCGDLIEIGVWRGGTGALIAKQCQLAGIEALVYLCDTFQGVVKASSRDVAYVGGEHADTSQAAVLELIRALQLDSVRILEGIFPDDTGHLLSGRLFRFCHIDVDVYDSAKDILNWVWPRLVPGGMVVYDDYGFYSCVGITRLVNEERVKPDRLVIHNLNGHAVVIKLGTDNRDRTLEGRTPPLPIC
jgi:O-methyltransferase